MNLFHPDYTVSKAFRQFVLEKLPALKINPRHRHLFAYIAFGVSPFKDEQSLRLDKQTVASLYACKPGYYKPRFRAQQHLASFSKEVMPITVDNFSYSSRRTRSLTGVDWPKNMLERVNSEILNWEAENRVFFVSGKRAYDQSLKARESALSSPVDNIPWMAQETKDVINYLNALPSAYFFRIKKHLPEAFKLAIQLEKDRDRQLKVLRMIADCAQPIYSSTKNSPRVFAKWGSLATVNRKLRKVLCQDWVEADLKSCQLAVIAKQWDIPELYKFLEDGGNIWQHLSEILGIQLTGEKKKIVKDAVYALVFGDKPSNIARDLEKLGKDAYIRFKRSSYIDLLFKAREVQFEKLKHENKVVDSLSREIQRFQFNNHRDPRKFERSVLAQSCQAVELQLLHPAIEEASKCCGSHNFKILLWQHDGFSFKASHKNETDHWFKKLWRGVNTKARELDIPTELVV